ncbi:MAG: hypothetical protein JJU36_07595 [Phycisphaeraceae bacterium]|nr:hypothetical protein [Phycisphaeraceae bacterium]
MRSRRNPKWCISLIAIAFLAIASMTPRPGFTAPAPGSNPAPGSSLGGNYALASPFPGSGMVAISGGAASPRTIDDGQQATFRAAVALLAEGLRPARDGSHMAVIQALRHLREPQLEPLMEHLAQSADPNLRVHGIMGLAELSEEGAIDLDRVLAFTRPEWQVEVLGAAMEYGLLSDAQASILMTMPNVDDGVKVLVAGSLARHGEVAEREVLRRAARSDHLSRAAVAAVILLQIQDPDAPAMMASIESRVGGRMREMIQQLALRTAYRFRFDRVGPWALGLIEDPQAGMPVRLAALELALEIEQESAGDAWLELFGQTPDLANQMRLALIALRTSSRGDPRVFERLSAMDEPMLRKLGRAGHAVATGGDSLAPLIELVESRHPPSILWIQKYAVEEARPELGFALLTRIIEMARSPRDEAVIEPGRAMRVDQAVTAVELLLICDDDSAVRYLADLLRVPDQDTTLVEVVLGGLVRSGRQRAAEVVEGLDPWDQSTLDELTAMVRGRREAGLSTDDLEHLDNVIRGSRITQRTLRIQAACIWLKHQGQLPEALDRIKTHSPASMEGRDMRAKRVGRAGP